MNFFVCPKCKTFPKVYIGCSNCGSEKIFVSRLIHHFKCAHVDSIQNFEIDGIIKCPKCLMKNLIVSSDFEYLEGPFECQECFWKDSGSRIVGFCDNCKLKFPIECCLEK